MKKTKLIPTLGAVCLLGTVACSHNAPAELVDARAAYDKAQSGPANKETPAELHTARRSLEQAEKSFEEDGDSELMRDQAYIAMRKAQQAEVHARIAQNEKRLTELERNMTQEQSRELARLRGDIATQRQQLALSEAARKESEAARKEAERRAEQAAADLARIASVKQEERGMVITLSGSVLFASGESQLLAGAQAKLSEVSNALTQQNPDASIVIEGHTDAQGKADFNVELSTKRAESVRDYLASHGVAPDRIRAVGVGFSRPIADNKTAEGRANNRRVEIIVQPVVRNGATAQSAPREPTAPSQHGTTPPG